MTPGTPMTPEDEQLIREWVAEDKRRGVVSEMPSRGASGLTVEALLATLDVEREAATRRETELRARIERIPWDESAGPLRDLIPRRAVLALLATDAGTEDVK